MKNINKQKKTIFIVICILIFSGSVYCFFPPTKNGKIENNIGSINFKKGFYYRITPWEKLIKGTNLHFEYQELTEESISSVVTTELIQKDEEKNIDGKIIEKGNDVVDEKMIIVREPWAQIFASLTGSAGSLGISGSSRNADMYFNDVNRGKYFSGGAGSSFTVFIDSGDNDRTVSMSSPAFAVNSTVKSLSIGIDPYSMYMTLSGHVELDLPGDIMGTLYNTSNGSSGGATLNNGYFSVSVPLSYGSNKITASGKWMTIELQLPTISVNISK